MMTLVADRNGRLSGAFTIPANIPAGAKQVVFTGRGGTQGRAIYVGRGTIITRLLRRVFTTTIIRWWQRVDPLAQTFTLGEDRHITSVDVEFCKIGNRDNPVTVQIRATALGLPGEQVLAEATLDMQDVKTGRWVNIPFSFPVFLEAGVEYALVFLTDDADHSLSVAELGKFDRRRQKWVTSQPYQVGVLLSSSNASTWTPHQKHDLAFRLNGARFTRAERTVEAGEVELADCTDLIIDAGVEEPAIDTSIVVCMTRADGQVMRVLPGQPVSFDRYVSEKVKIAFELKGSDRHSPVLYPAIQIIQGELQKRGDYLSRAMPAAVSGETMKVTITFDCLLPGDSAVKVEAGADKNWSEAALATVTPLGDGWQERTYELKDYIARDARVKLTLSGGPAARPQLRALRANVTEMPRNITE